MKSASSASDALRLNSSSARQVSRTASAAATAPSERSRLRPRADPRAGPRAPPPLRRRRRRSRGPGTTPRGLRVQREAPPARRRMPPAGRADRPHASGDRGLDGRLLALLRLRTPSVRGREQHGRCFAADRTPDRGRRTARRRSAPRAATQPPDRAAGARGRAVPRRSRKRPDFRFAALRRLAAIHSRTARSESRRKGTSWQRERIVSGSGPSSLATSTMTAYERRLLEVLEQRVRRVLVHALRLEHEVHPTIALERSHVQVVAQRAHVVDADHLAERLEHVEIRVRARLDSTLVPEQRAANANAALRFPTPPGRGGGTPAHRPPRGPTRAGAWPRAAQERTRRAPYTSSAILSAGSVPSRTTMRSGKRAASSR